MAVRGPSCWICWAARATVSAPGAPSTRPACTAPSAHLRPPSLGTSSQALTFMNLAAKSTPEDPGKGTDPLPAAPALSTNSPPPRAPPYPSSLGLGDKGPQPLSPTLFNPPWHPATQSRGPRPPHSAEPLHLPFLLLPSGNSQLPLSSPSPTLTVSHGLPPHRPLPMPLSPGPASCPPYQEPHTLSRKPCHSLRPQAPNPGKPSSPLLLMPRSSSLLAQIRALLEALTPPPPGMILPAPKTTSPGTCPPGKPWKVSHQTRKFLLSTSPRAHLPEPTPGAAPSAPPRAARASPETAAPAGRG